MGQYAVPVAVPTAIEILGIISPFPFLLVAIPEYQPVIIINPPILQIYSLLIIVDEALVWSSLSIIPHHELHGSTTQHGNFANELQLSTIHLDILLLGSRQYRIA